MLTIFYEFLQSEIFPDKNQGGRSFYNEAVMSAQGIPQVSDIYVINVLDIYALYL